MLRSTVNVYWLAVGFVTVTVPQPGPVQPPVSHTARSLPLRMYTVSAKDAGVLSTINAATAAHLKTRKEKGMRKLPCYKAEVIICGIYPLVNTPAMPSTRPVQAKFHPPKPRAAERKSNQNGSINYEK